MASPSSDEQVGFLMKLQRLLGEGQFVATYKYALLQALADIAIEKGKDDDSTLEITTRQIAEKFIIYYWRQCSPYASFGRSESRLGVLRQNTGKQAGIVTLVEHARVRSEGSLAEAMRHASQWTKLVSAVNQIVKVMPLWKLQTVGRENFDFLYQNTGQGSSIILKPGIAACFRKFHTLTTDLIRGAWVRYVRRFNPELTGSTSDLHEFLFGSERADLTDVAIILREVQQGQCFYCLKHLVAATAHVDHFVPWSRYPVDLGHNFVLAHNSCNNSKSDRLAALIHLEHWVENIQVHRVVLHQHFTRKGIINDLPTTARVTDWAYRQTFDAGGSTWLRGNELLPLKPEWSGLLSRLSVQE